MSALAASLEPDTDRRHAGKILVTRWSGAGVRLVQVAGERSAGEGQLAGSDLVVRDYSTAALLRTGYTGKESVNGLIILGHRG